MAVPCGGAAVVRLCACKHGIGYMAVHMFVRLTCPTPLAVRWCLCRTRTLTTERRQKPSSKRYQRRTRYEPGGQALAVALESAPRPILVQSEFFRSMLLWIFTQHSRPPFTQARQAGVPNCTPRPCCAPAAPAPRCCPTPRSARCLTATARRASRAAQGQARRVQAGAPLGCRLEASTSEPQRTSLQRQGGC